MVIYHGKRVWKAPASFHEIVAPLPAALAPFVPSFTYQLVDLSERIDAEIRGAVLTRLVQLALSWVYSDTPRERLRELLVLIERFARTLTRQQGLP
jgi:hypothetical protein